VKSLPLASLTLVASLSLTGCASSPSLEDQTKLIEYEKCLSYNEMLASRIIDQGISQRFSPEYDDFVFTKNLSQCAKYRP